MNSLHKGALALTIVGALNWLLVGAFHLNLVLLIFGDYSLASRIIYILIGVGGVYCISLFSTLTKTDSLREVREIRRAA
jgi:uncharacterized protein